MNAYEIYHHKFTIVPSEALKPITFLKTSRKSKPYLKTSDAVPESYSLCLQMVVTTPPLPFPPSSPRLNQSNINNCQHYFKELSKAK